MKTFLFIVLGIVLALWVGIVTLFLIKQASWNKDATARMQEVVDYLNLK